MSEGEQLARDVADAAERIHGNDEAAAIAMIKNVVSGNGIWCDSVRGLAQCHYLISVRKPE